MAITVKLIPTHGKRIIMLKSFVVAGQRTDSTYIFDSMEQVKERIKMLEMGTEVQIIDYTGQYTETDKK